MKFKKEDLIELTWGDGSDEFAVLSNELIDTTRWSTVHELVFEYGGKTYRTSYTRGATECQDEQPFEYEPDEVECAEVRATTVEVVKYIEV